MTFPYGCCVFDLYGTLADIRTDEEDPALWRGFSAFLRGYGVRLSGAALRKAYLEGCARETERCAAELTGQGISGPEEISILKVWERIAAENGTVMTHEDACAVSRRFRQLSTRKLRLFDGAREVLDGLRRAGCLVVLLTNAQASFTLPELETLGIAGAFDRVLISSEAGVRKPSPVFFGLMFQDGLSPADCLMVGNDDRCDCLGAARAGMDSLYICTEQSPPRTAPLPGRCREITSLRSILCLRERISDV